MASSQVRVCAEHSTKTCQPDDSSLVPLTTQMACSTTAPDEESHAARDLAEEALRKRNATLAALDAAQAAGGDEQLIETLQQRLRFLTKQTQAVGTPSRVHLRAKQLERRAEIGRLRLESKAQETKERELALTIS